MNSLPFSDLRDSPTRGVKLLAIFGLVLMVAFAGCSGMNPIGSDDGSDSSSNGEKKKEEVTYPAGFSKEGVTDPGKAAENHYKKLFDHDSFKQNFIYNMSVSGRWINMGIVVNVNIKNKQVRLVSDMSLMGQSLQHYELYQSKGKEYTINQSSKNSTTYNVSESSFKPNDAHSFLGMDNYLKNASFGKAKEVKRNGKTVLRYEVKNTSNATSFTVGGSVSNPTVSDFNGTLFVDQNGIIQEFRYSISYTTADGTKQRDSVTYKITNLDSTTVEKPDWVEDAKAQASS